MRRNPLRQRQSRRHQKRRPVHTVKAHNLFSDHVYVRRPVAFKLCCVLRPVPERRHIIRQRIQPHINHVLRIVRHRDAPSKRAAADRKIAQPAAHKRQHLVPPRLRANKIRLLRVQLNQPLLKCRQLEKIILFLHRLRRPPALRARRSRPHRIHIQFVIHAILASVMALVDVARVRNPLPQRLHAALVPLRSRADKVVVREPHAVPQRAKFSRHFVGKLLRSRARRLRRPLNLLSMLVGSRQEPRVVAEHPMPPRNRVAGYRGVRMPDVRPRIDVINRSRDVKRFAHDFVVTCLQANM